MITNEGRIASLVELKWDICLSFFCEHCSSSGLRRTFKVLFYLKMWSCWNHLSCSFCNGHSFWNSQCQCHFWLNVTAYHNAPQHYKMLQFIFDSVSLVCMYMHSYLYSWALSARGVINPHFILDIVTINDLTLIKVTVFRMDWFHLLIGLSGLECFCFLSLTAKDLDASHHCTRANMLPWTFFLLYF